jgi:MFS family permease
MPYALAFGRRPAFIAAYLMLLFSTIGAAAAQNFPGHLAARVLQGLACGAAESLLPLMLTEIIIIIIIIPFNVLCKSKTIVGRPGP